MKGSDKAADGNDKVEALPSAISTHAHFTEPADDSPYEDTNFKDAIWSMEEFQ